MLNRAILMGRLTRDPELRQTPNNVSVATFSLAVDRNYQADKNNKQTDFINIVAWRHTAEFVGKYFTFKPVAIKIRMEITVRHLK